MSSVITHATYENGVQTTHGVWRKAQTSVVEYVPLLWQRRVGAIIMTQHEDCLTEFGWLLDDEENPRAPLPGGRRKFFEAFMCITCDVTWAGVPRERGEAAR